MYNDVNCRHCGSNKFTRSRVKNPVEWIVFPFAIPMRCYVCGMRQLKLRAVAGRGKPRADKSKPVKPASDD